MEAGPPDLPEYTAEVTESDEPEYLPRLTPILPGGPARGVEETTKQPTPKVISRQSEAALVGQALGSFRIVRRLGKGRMSTVYLAEHLAIGSQVALKLLHPYLAEDPWVVARFYAEARALCLAVHENIVSVYDTGSAGPDLHYLTMELLEGRPLSAEAAAGPLPPERVVPLLAQICDALESGHRRGLVHRNLRPENIVLIHRGGTDHFVKLLDFGTAALSATQALQPSAVPADGRADLQALGAIARLLLAGRNGAFPDQAAGVPAALSEVLGRVLSERLEERYRTAEDFKRALLAAVPGEPLAVAPEPPKPRPLPPAPKAPPAPVEQETPTLPPRRTRPPSAAPARREPDRATPLPMEVRGAFREASGRELGLMRCIHLSRGGLFACTQGPLPPLLSRLALSLQTGNTELSCQVEVVRHVDAAQGRAWGMPPGFGVQFLEPSSAFRDSLVFKDALARLLQGQQPLGEPAPAGQGDPDAEPLLSEVLHRSTTDPYAFLSLPKEAPMADVRHRSREERQRLEALRDRPLSAEQVMRLEACLRQVAWALSLLGQPARRAELDARLGNFQGVARCIAAGLPAPELEACRQRFLASNRATETRAMVHALTARTFLAQGNLDRALIQFESALAQDPLNLELHREYWALKHRAASSPRPAPLDR